MDQKLKGLKIAILVADGFEQVEMVEPKKALEEAGAETVLISPVMSEVKGWVHKKWGDVFPVGLELTEAQVDNFDGLLLPGGVMSPDTLRMNSDAVAFVKGFIKAHKPIAAICHGPWTLINAEGVRGKMITSWPSLKIDLVNAGAKWVDEEVAKDVLLVTSRKPEDIPAFNSAMISLFAQRHSFMDK